MHIILHLAHFLSFTLGSSRLQSNVRSSLATAVVVSCTAVEFYSLLLINVSNPFRRDITIFNLNLLYAQGVSQYFASRVQ